MTYFSKLFPALLCCFFLHACQAGKDDEIVIVTTAPEFQVDLFEQRDSIDGAAMFGLLIKSIRSFPCANFKIEGDVQISGNQVRVYLNDVLEPDSCQGAAGTAQRFLAIGNLAPGSYSFSLFLKDALESSGTLTIGASSSALSIDQQQGIDFQQIVLNKIPEGLLWGYATTPDPDAAARIDAFLADLKNISSEPALSPGYYSYFTLAGTGLVALRPGFAAPGPAQVFVRQLNAAPQGLSQLLQQYRPQSSGQIRCLTTFGAL